MPSVAGSRERPSHWDEPGCTSSLRSSPRIRCCAGTASLWLRSTTGARDAARVVLASPARARNGSSKWRSTTRAGATRESGALFRISDSSSDGTIKRVLAENGIDPAGRRPMRWKTFLKAHWGAIAATDFFTIEGITWRGLVRYFVLFVIDLKTRQVEIAGIVTSPDGAWMRQIARNWTDSEDGFLLRSRYLIHDRDPLFTKGFREILDGSGVRPVGFRAAARI